MSMMIRCVGVHFHNKGDKWMKRQVECVLTCLWLNEERERMNLWIRDRWSNHMSWMCLWSCYWCGVRWEWEDRWMEREWNDLIRFDVCLMCVWWWRTNRFECYGNFMLWFVHLNNPFSYLIPSISFHIFLLFQLPPVYFLRGVVFKEEGAERP